MSRAEDAKAGGHLATVTEWNNRFALDIHGSLRKRPGNLFLFPRSTSGSTSPAPRSWWSRGSFLAFSWLRNGLDGLTTRSKAIAILANVSEADSSVHSPRLAVASSSHSLSERPGCLLRPEG